MIRVKYQKAFGRPVINVWCVQKREQDWMEMNHGPKK